MAILDIPKSEFTKFDFTQNLRGRNCQIDIFDVLNESKLISRKKSKSYVKSYIDRNCHIDIFDVLNESKLISRKRNKSYVKPKIMLSMQIGMYGTA